MKRLIATLMTLIVLSIAVVPASAQTRDRRSYRRAAQARYDEGYDTRRYQNDEYWYEDDRSVWEKHRDKITTVGGAVGGAVLGGLIGGKKGSIIGAITGGAGAAIYTYKIRDKARPY